MVNNYNWGLDSISHSAHYSQNWDKNKQNEYNRWYYENKTKKKTTESRIPDTPYTINDVEEFNSKNKELLNNIPKHEKSSNWSTIPEMDPNAKKSDLGKLIDLYGDLKLDRDYIEHHGVDHQKWGVKNGPPYPLDSNLSTGKSLKPAALGNNKLEASKNKISEKTKRKRQIAAEKARQTKAENAKKKIEAEEHAKEVKRIVESGDKYKIQSIASELSYDELRIALNKADLMTRLNAQTSKSTLDRIDAVKRGLDKSIEYYQTAAKIWNLTAQIYNQKQTNEKDKLVYLPTNTSPSNSNNQQPQNKKTA